MPRRARSLPWTTTAVALASLLVGVAARADGPSGLVPPVRPVRPPKEEAPATGTPAELSALYLTPIVALGTPGRRAFIAA